MLNEFSNFATIGSFFVGLPALGVVFRRINRARRDDVGGIMSRLDTLEERTEQLVPNGGSSLADSIRRHEDKCEATHLQLVTLFSELVK